jgi:hypothetical protein
MRASSAVLTDTTVRLWDLAFPSSRALLARTRAAYVHLDNLIAFSKRDRDGMVDAYLTVYLPDEVVLLFFLGGDLVNAAILTSASRFQASISEAMRHIRSEPERAEIAFHEASLEQLAAMYASCSQAPQDLGIDPSSAEAIFRTLLDRRWSGLLELIARGQVNYILVRDGRFASGLFAERGPDDTPGSCVARLFAVPPGEARARVSVKAFAGLPAVPEQAAPSLVSMFRHFAWDLVDLAEGEMPRDAGRRSERIRMKLVPEHDALQSVGGPRGIEVADPIVEPSVLADAVAAWVRAYLGELEIVHPQIAARLLREAGREHRFALDAVGFFDKLPWRIEW